MAKPEAGAPAPRLSEIVSTAHRDPGGAARALASRSYAEQVEVVCQLPAALRPSFLEQLPEPERVIPALPEGELCFTLKAVGIHDSAWMVEFATDDQMVACVDLDAWNDIDLDPDSVHRWMRCVTEAGDETLLRVAAALDPEILVWWLQDRLVVVQRSVQPSEFEAPEGAKTLDGTFFLIAKRDKDDLSTPIRLLTLLYEDRHAEYERLLLGVCFETATENTEWALRWRGGRLADLGFPQLEATFGLYAPLRAGEIDNAPVAELRGTSWRLPVWVPPLPAAEREGLPIFGVASELSAEDQQSFFFALLSLANHVAVADRLPLGDPESVPRSMTKAAELTNRGLLMLSEHQQRSPRDVLASTPLPFLFRVGYTLARNEDGAPRDGRPTPSAEALDRDHRAK